MSVEDADRIAAFADMIGRTGAKRLEVRFSEPEAEGDRLVWLCVADYGDRWDAAAGRSPGHAAERLLDQLLDGGICQHCGKTTAVHHEPNPPPMSNVCWYAYDPELNTYRRACEGLTMAAQGIRLQIKDERS